MEYHKTGQAKPERLFSIISTGKFPQPAYTTTETTVAARRLSNGLQVLEKKFVPTVSFALVFKADKANNARYETGSTILTTNQPFAKQGKTFANNMVAAAIVDRLSHRNEPIRHHGGQL